MRVVIEVTTGAQAEVRLHQNERTVGPQDARGLGQDLGDLLVVKVLKEVGNLIQEIKLYYLILTTTPKKKKVLT